MPEETLEQVPRVPSSKFLEAFWSSVRNRKVRFWEGKRIRMSTLRLALLKSRLSNGSIAELWAAWCMFRLSLFPYRRAAWACSPMEYLLWQIELGCHAEDRTPGLASFLVHPAAHEGICWSLDGLWTYKSFSQSMKLMNGYAVALHRNSKLRSGPGLQH